MTDETLALAKQIFASRIGSADIVKLYDFNKDAFNTACFNAAVMALRAAEQFLLIKDRDDSVVKPDSVGKNDAV